MIVKVKEPQAVEIARLKPHHILFTYLHLAPDPEQTKGLMKSGATCIAYETITDANGRLPLLAPMSQVAGRMATQVGAALRSSPPADAACCLRGVPGVLPAKVVSWAAAFRRPCRQMAVGMRADVTVFDRSRRDVLRRIDARFGATVRTLYSTTAAVEAEVAAADLVIGAVLVPGAAAPKLVSRAVALASPASAPRQCLSVNRRAIPVAVEVAKARHRDQVLTSSDRRGPGPGPPGNPPRPAARRPSRPAPARR